MKLSKRINQLSKKQKMIMATVAVLVVLVGSFGYKAYADSQAKKQVEQAQKLVDERSKEIKDLQIEIEALFNTEKTDFLNKDVTNETIIPIQEKLDSIEKNYDSIVLPTKDVKTKDYSNYLTTTKESLKTVQLMLDTQKQVNGLFGKAVIVGDVVSKDVAIKDDLKADAVKKVKDSYYNKEKKSEWQKAINLLIEDADSQLKQMDKAKLAVDKVYKDNKVINAEQKNYDSAKSETDKIKNQKAKKELSDKLAKVRQEIDAKIKVESEKKAQEQSVEVMKTQETPTGKLATNVTSPVTETDNTEVVATGGNDAINQGYPANDNTGVPSGGNGSNAGNNGSASTGGQTGGTDTPPAPPVTPPTEPQQPTEPPAGWIVPPFSIGSIALVNWLADQGYSGYDSSGGYIRPY